MRIKFIYILLGVCIIAETPVVRAQKLFPVQGPLSAETPVPAYNIKIAMSGVGSLSHKLSVALADGEVVSGEYTVVKTVTSADTQVPGTEASYPPQPNLAFAWDSVYGPGYFVAKILGGQLWQAVLKGDRGTVLQVEFLEIARPTNRSYGVAIDNKGNVYKLVQ